MFQFNTPSPHMQHYKQCVVSFVSSIYSSLLLSKENEGEKPLADWTNSVNLLGGRLFPKEKDDSCDSERQAGVCQILLYIQHTQMSHRSPVSMSNTSWSYEKLTSWHTNCWRSCRYSDCASTNTGLQQHVLFLLFLVLCLSNSWHLIKMPLGQLPSKGFLGEPNWERPQSSLESFCILSGLSMPWDPTGGAVTCCWEKGHLKYLP